VRCGSVEKKPRLDIAALNELKPLAPAYGFFGMPSEDVEMEPAPSVLVWDRWQQECHYPI
jgi:hypothetical protein